MYYWSYGACRRMRIRLGGIHEEIDVHMYIYTHYNTILIAKSAEETLGIDTRLDCGLFSSPFTLCLATDPCCQMLMLNQT